jgi:hypothetical protein
MMTATYEEESMSASILWIVVLAVDLENTSKVSALCARIKSVGKEGAGNAEAAQAWKELVHLGPSVLPGLLSAIDDRDPISANWLQTAVDSIAETALTNGRPLPTTELQALIRDRNRSRRGRRLAYECLTRVDAGAPARLLPGLLNDPSPELRRDAVAATMHEAQRSLGRGARSAATEQFRKAFAAALDRDQVAALATRLGELGVSVDIAAHFGFIRNWRVIGPFDGPAGVAFRTAYPPEQGGDRSDSYTGKAGKTLQWSPCTSSDSYGVVDLNKALGRHHGCAAYALAIVEIPEARPVELRVGSNNGIKIFLNGDLVFAREEYHHGSRMDQHVGRGRLHAGRNEILLKACQNEQTEDWAQDWSFQLRVCDASGVAVPLKVPEPK